MYFPIVSMPQPPNHLLDEISLLVMHTILGKKSRCGVLMGCLELEKWFGKGKLKLLYPCAIFPHFWRSNFSLGTDM